MRAAVVTVSDAGSRGEREDRSGPALAELLRGAGFEVDGPTVVPDEPPVVAGVVRAAVDAGARVVVTTGGTGLGPRDRTPEALAPLLDRELPGFGEAMRAAGRASTPMADLSRSLAGTLGGAVVLAVPGSRAGATESLGAVLGLLPHAVELLGGDTGHADGAPDAGGTASSTSTAAVTSVTSITTATEATWVADVPPSVADDHPHLHDPDDPCHLAHTAGVPDERRPGTLVAVYASPLSSLLLSWGRDLGYRRLVLVEPTGEAGHAATHADEVVASVDEAGVDGDTDVVVTDHGRDDIVEQADRMLASDARWLGMMGSARHTGPHVEGLRARGRTDAEIDRIERPVGLDIGSRTPPEIALSVLAGVVASRQGRR